MVLVTFTVDLISVHLTLATRKSLTVAKSPYFTFPLFLSFSFFSLSPSLILAVFFFVYISFLIEKPLQLASSHYSLRFFHVNSLLFLSTFLRIGVLSLPMTLFPSSIFPLSLTTFSVQIHSLCSPCQHNK